MPRATIRIEGRVGRFGERSVDVATVARVGRTVERRADERMREMHAQPQLDQSGADGGVHGFAVEPEMPGGAPQQPEIAERLGRGGQEQELRVARKRSGALQVGLLDAARQRTRVG
jgi:hypothetical protein